MILSWWRKLVDFVAQYRLRNPQKPRKRSTQRFLRWAFLSIEQLEERITPTTFRWTGAAGANWSDPGNWNIVSSTNTDLFPNATSDAAQFTGSPTSSLVIVNQAITVGELDFGTASNITIQNSGGNVLTLQNTSGNAILNVGSGAFTNTGTDTIAAPITVSPLTPLAATISGGTLALTNTASAPANSIGSTSTFSVTAGGTLQVAGAGTDPLGQAAIVDNGGLLQVTAGVSTNATLPNPFTVGANTTSAIDLAGAVTGVTLGSLTANSGSPPFATST